MVHMFFNGGGMRGGPLHDALRGAPFVAETESAPRYRFYAVRGEYPAMEPVDDGGRPVRGEVYDVPLDVLRDSLLPVEPPELELGVIELEDGTGSLSMRMRAEALTAPGVRDISDAGGWRAYLAGVAR